MGNEAMRMFVAVVGCVVALAAVSGAGAGAGGTATDPTDAQIDALVESLGVDPESVVIQRGKRNYAGPNCPGSGWNCTTASNVVQVTSNGTNEVDCDTSPESTTDPPAIAQTNVNGNNEATCEWKSSESGEQNFTLVQTNVNGANKAQFTVEVKDQTGATQTAFQDVEAQQQNEDGDNHLVIKHTMELITTTGAVQQQNGRQDAFVVQRTVTGDNFAQVTEFMLAHAFQSGGTIDQEQNADPLLASSCGTKPSPNQCADIQQETAEGKDELQLDQEIELEVKAEGTTDVEQTQGHSGGGIAGQVFQNGQQVSTFNGNQEETQKRSAPEGSPGATQIIDPNCCATQVGGADHFAQIHQKAEQQSTPDNSFQDATNEVECNSTGRCQTQSTITQDGQTNTFECDDTFCFYVQFCERGGEGDFCDVFEGGSEASVAESSRRGG